MNRFPVDVRAYGAVMAADATAQPVRAYENGTATGGQSVSPEGVPMWRGDRHGQVPRRSAAVVRFAE